MVWPPLDTHLPTPRDDEPSSLREDLMDEVRDHLQSAYLGELLKTPDPVQAERNVLARFGDPARVVRELWFQAMWEKIMSQRILVGTCLVMATASLVGVGLMWNLNQQSQSAMLQSQRDLIASLEESQKSNLQLLQTFMTEQKTLTTKADPEWCPVKIRCSLGKKGGPPAKGFVVSFQRPWQEDSPPEPTKLTVPDDGLVDLGLLQFGKYDLRIRSPEGESPDFYTTGELEILPRLPQTPLYGEFVCPEGLPAQVTVKPQVIWPEPLRDKHLWLLCTFSSVWELDGRGWDLGAFPTPDHPWKNPRSLSKEGHDFQGGGGFGGGGFGQFNSGLSGIGYCSIQDNLDQHMRPTQFGFHSWQCLINEHGDIWDLGLARFGGTDFPLNNGYLDGITLSKFLDPPNSFDYGRIIEQFSELTSGVTEVKWPTGELRLESVEVYSAPHKFYGYTTNEIVDGTSLSRSFYKVVTTQNLLASFRVQPVRNSEEIHADDSLRKFRGIPGQENALQISIQESWVATIQQKEEKLKDFHTALELAKAAKNE